MIQEHFRVTVGATFYLNGDQHIVEALSGTTILARSSKGQSSLYHAAHLFNMSGFSIDDSSAGPAISESPLNGVPDGVVTEAKALAKHLLEAITGYQSGTREDATAGEPRHEYDPEVFNLSQRIAHKASELRKTERAIWQAKQSYDAHGLMGLVDKRKLKQKGTFIDDRVRMKLREVIASFEEESNPTKAKLQRLTDKGLRESFPGMQIELPSTSTFNRLVDLLAQGTQLFGDAKQRRSIAKRPEQPYSHFFADRPGELVVIDSTPLNVFAMDPYSFLWIQVQLTIALDILSRSLLAWRFTPVSTKGVDASFMLHDILRPKPMRSSWKSTMKWAYVGVPENILVELGGDPDHPLPLAALPFLHPESVLVDRGRVFLSEAFMNACRTLGINLLVARPYTPTDKSHVERVFKTIETFLMTLKGYKGPDIRSRGLDPEGEAFWFIDEIDELFGEWVGEYYQNCLHKGLELPHVPALKISPNHMIQEGITRAGFVVAPRDANLFYRLLPTAWRTIQHYGVDLDLRYDGDILNDFRNQKSPYGGKHQGKWPFGYDPRDRSAIYFMDPATGAWHTLRWVGADSRPRPFSAKTLSYAKSLVLARHLDPTSERDTKQVLYELLDRIEDRQMQGGKERRIAALEMIQAENAAKDRATARQEPPPTLVAPATPETDEEQDAIDRNREVYQQPAAKHIVDGAFRIANATDEKDEDLDI